MTTYTAEDAHAAVARGAQWMDEHCNWWVSEIDLGKLNLEDSSWCVLGQTTECLTGRRAHSYVAVINHFQQTTDWAVEHGFEAPSPHPTYPAGECDPKTCRREHETRYEMLTLTWRELVRERLAAGVPQ